MCAVCLYVCAQNIPEQNIENLSVVSLHETESQYLIQDEDIGTASQKEPVSKSGVWQFIKLIIVLALVIACIYGLVWLLKKTSNPAFVPSPYLKKVATVNLGQGKSVHIISTSNQAFIVGAAENSVNLIGEIKDKDLIDAMNINAEKNEPSVKKDFSQILSSFLKSNKKNKNENESEITSFDSYFTNAAIQSNRAMKERVERLQDNQKQSETEE